ncbi:Protein of unknown function [Gryllus bimaculatus]|nr:Protein of unknown function [Gryllus bimaculatus]
MQALIEACDSSQVAVSGRREDEGGFCARVFLAITGYWCCEDVRRSTTSMAKLVIETGCPSPAGAVLAVPLCCPRPGIAPRYSHGVGSVDWGHFRFRHGPGWRSRSVSRVQWRGKVNGRKRVCGCEWVRARLLGTSDVRWVVWARGAAVINGRRRDGLGEGGNVGVCDWVWARGCGDQWAEAREGMRWRQVRCMGVGAWVWARGCGRVGTRWSMAGGAQGVRWRARAGRRAGAARRGRLERPHS